MPPKKAAPGKKNAEPEKNEVKIPVNTCDFKIEMEVKHEGGHYLKIKYEWISVDPNTSEISFQPIDSGFFKDWKLVQIEGEEPVLEESLETVGKAAAPTRGSAGRSKPAAQQKGAQKALEEITDNRPRIVKLERDCAQENNGVGLEVFEEVAIKMSQTILSLQVFETDRETQEESLKETIALDLSCLLYPNSEVNFEWRFNSMKTIAIDYLQLKISSQMPLLSEFYRKKLNPLQINLVAVKDIPFKTEPKFRPIYATLKFVDGQEFHTLEMAQQQHCRFMQKHVFLVGLMDHVMLKELLNTTPVRVIVHDNDEYTVEQDSDQTFSVGQASFTLKDFLRPYTSELKLRSDVFPLKRAIVDQTENLDLNKTARRGEKAVEKFSPYLVNSTYAVIQANLSYPIGSFSLAAEMLALERAMIERQWEESGAQEQPNTAGQASQVKDSGSVGSRPQTKAGMDQTMSQMNDHISHVSIDELKSASQFTTNQTDYSGAVFERMVIVVPYKSADTVSAIESSFESINLEGLGLESARYLNTKELSEEERKDRSLDYLGGFEIMDSEFRMFIVEGLGGPGKAMEKFYKANERERPNDKRYKMLYNPQVRYKNRMYMDFNCSLKRIKLRDTLTSLMSAADVYLRSKVPEDMYDTLQKFAEIRKLERASLIRDFNLFPIPVNLLTLERKYGDALSFEDINGFRQRKARRRTRRDTSVGTIQEDDGKSEYAGAKSRTDVTSMELTKSRTTAKLQQKTTTMVSMSNEDDESEEDSVFIPKKLKADTDHKNQFFEQSLRNRTIAASTDYIKVNRQSLLQMSQGRPPKARIDVPDNFEVHPYGNQKHNIWEMQKEQMRKMIAGDKEHFYTYSMQNLSGSFPLVNENEIKLKAKLDSEARWVNKRGFDNIGKRTSWNQHGKKPDVAKQDELRYPYFKQQQETKARLAQKLYRPQDHGKDVFIAGAIPDKKTFSDANYFNTVFISGDGMAKEMQEQKAKEQADWQRKIVVANKHFFVNTREGKSSQKDKYRGVLQDPPQKLGLKLGSKRLTQMAGRQITATKSLKDLPVSSLMKEPYIMNEQSIKPIKNALDSTKTPYNRTIGAQETRDFDRYTQAVLRNKNPASRIPIKVMTDAEKVGPKFGR